MGRIYNMLDGTIASILKSDDFIVTEQEDALGGKSLKLKTDYGFVYLTQSAHSGGFVKSSIHLILGANFDNLSLDEAMIASVMQFSEYINAIELVMEGSTK